MSEEAQEAPIEGDGGHCRHRSFCFTRLKGLSLLLSSVDRQASFPRSPTEQGNTAFSIASDLWSKHSILLKFLEGIAVFSCCFVCIFSHYQVKHYTFEDVTSCTKALKVFPQWFFLSLTTNQACFAMILVFFLNGSPLLSHWESALHNFQIPLTSGVQEDP
jgi:hypothetical protein